MIVVEDEDTSDTTEASPHRERHLAGGDSYRQNRRWPSARGMSTRRGSWCRPTRGRGAIRMASLVEESQLLATIDPLTASCTAVPSHKRSISARLCHAVWASSSSGVLMDLDHFKQINDRYGHGSGDAVLAAAGASLVKQARKGDLLAGWGGESSYRTARYRRYGRVGCCRTLENDLDFMVKSPDGDVIPTTVSIGVAAYRPGESLEALIDRADRAMYRAKSGGRNRVVTDAKEGTSADEHPAQKSSQSIAPSA